MNSAQRAAAISCVNTAPIEARTASTEKGSAQSSIRISPPAPTASPVLQDRADIAGIAQRLRDDPERRRRPVDPRRARCRAGGRRRAASADCPCRSSCERMSALVSIASPPAASVAAMISAASGCCAPSAEKATISGSRPLSRASVRIRSPSARNSPSARRAFLSRSQRSRLTVGLEKAVTCARHHRHSSPKRSSTSAHELARAPARRRAPVDVDDDRVAHRGAEHHQAHDRGAADACCRPSRPRSWRRSRWRG